jgi:hypothetical protein
MTHPLLERLRRQRVPVAVSRLTAWVRSLAGRHARLAGGRPATGVLLVPPRPRPRVTGASTVVRVLARVGVDVRVTRAAAAVRTVERPGGAPAAAPLPQARPTPVAAPGRLLLLPAPPAPRPAVAVAVAPARSAPAAPPAVAASRTAVLRLVEHRRRIEGPPWRPLREPAEAPAARAGRPAAAPRPEALRQPGTTAFEAWARPRASMVLAPGPAAAVVAAAAAVTPPVPARPDEPAPRGAAAVPAPPAPDVERLTDEVVRQIDRRIAAHRERLGRI